MAASAAVVAADVTTSTFKVQASVLKKHKAGLVKDMAIVVEIFNSLENLSVSKGLLEDTRIGRFVNDFRRTVKNEALAKRAKNLLKKWREAVKLEDGLASSKSQNGAGDVERLSSHGESYGSLSPGIKLKSGFGSGGGINSTSSSPNFTTSTNVSPAGSFNSNSLSPSLMQKYMNKCASSSSSSNGNYIVHTHNAFSSLQYLDSSSLTSPPINNNSDKTSLVDASNNNSKSSVNIGCSAGDGNVSSNVNNVRVKNDVQDNLSSSGSSGKISVFTGLSGLEVGSGLFSPTLLTPGMKEDEGDGKTSVSDVSLLLGNDDVSVPDGCASEKSELASATTETPAVANPPPQKRKRRRKSPQRLMGSELLRQQIAKAQEEGRFRPKEPVLEDRLKVSKKKKVEKWSVPGSGSLSTPHEFRSMQCSPALNPSLRQFSPQGRLLLPHASSSTSSSPHMRKDMKTQETDLNDLKKYDLKAEVPSPAHVIASSSPATRFNSSNAHISAPPSIDWGDSDEEDSGGDTVQNKTSCSNSQRGSKEVKGSKNGMESSFGSTCQVIDASTTVLSRDPFDPMDDGEQLGASSGSKINLPGRAFYPMDDDDLEDEVDDGRIKFNKDAITEEDVDRLHSTEIDNINGIHDKDQNFKGWHETAVVESTNGAPLHILPYVLIDF